MSGNSGIIGCPILNTQALVNHGLVLDGTKQTIGSAVIYPPDWLNPFDPSTGVIRKTENTVSIHWYSAAWLSPWRRLRTRIMRPLHRIFGVDVFKRFRK